jgi:hypothetical protein
MKNNLFRTFAGGLAALGILTLCLSAPSCKKSSTTPTPPVNPGGTADTIPAPTITDFSPKKGLAGSTLVITGTNFDKVATNNSVKINGVAAVVSQVTLTQLAVTVPAGATSGKITTTVGTQTATSTAIFTVTTPLKISATSGIPNQLLYLTGGNGFGTVPDSNAFALYSAGTGHFSNILGYTNDTVVLLVPYAIPAVYTDTAYVDGIKVSLGSFTVDTPALTTMGVVSNISPSPAAKGTTVTLTIINGSNVAGSTTVSLIALYQKTTTPVELPCTVNTLTAGPFGSTVISFLVPDGVVASTNYAVKVSVNGLTAYGGLNQWFTAN